MPLTPGAVVRNLWKGPNVTDEYCAVVDVVLAGDEGHGGPGWYYYDTEYPEEGCVGPYATEAEARAAARAAYGECEGTR